MIEFYIQPAGSVRWCQLDVERTTASSYMTSCSARIDATEVLFLAQHPPGQVCSACRLKPRQSLVSGQITTVSRVSLDALADNDAYAAYEIIPGEIDEGTVIVDVDHEIEDACEAIREWGGA